MTSIFKNGNGVSNLKLAQSKFDSAVNLFQTVINNLKYSTDLAQASLMENKERIIVLETENQELSSLMEKSANVMENLNKILGK
jgi:hypothetical protein